MLTPKRLTATEALFEKRGTWLIVASCFSAVLRMVTAPLAGTLAVPASRFAAAMAVSAVLWSVSTTTAIYFAGLAMLAVLALASLPAWRRSPRPVEA